MNAADAVAAGLPVLARSFDEWRAAARELIVRRVSPESVKWIASEGEVDLLSSLDSRAPVDAAAVASPGAAAGAVASRVATVTAATAATTVAAAAAATAAPAATAASAAGAAGNGDTAIAVTPAQLRIPRKLMDLLASAACFRVGDRWAFLYKVLWRWQRGEQEVMSMADTDGGRLQNMVKAVHREEHDMHAYLRFRERPEEAGAPRFVAWFEPAHDILPQVAQHFVKRMGRTSWMIGTPDATLLWDGETLHCTGPLMRSAADIDDAGEALWLTYYRSIFNPARLNPDIMHGHVRSRFWKNMPEAALVPEMVSQAAAGARRTGQTGTVGRRSGTTIPIAADKAQPERQQPSTLDECRRCDLWQNATQAVPGEGAKRARIMLVGEQPGDQEDLAGKPFVGPAGALLDRVLAQAGVDRGTVYVTNAVKHFKWEPRGKRRLHKTPAQREILACHYWLEGELEQVGPQVIVALGSTALKAVLEDASASLKDFMGSPVQHNGRWVVATYHPAYVLRVPGSDAKALALASMVESMREAKRLGGA